MGNTVSGAQHLTQIVVETPAHDSTPQTLETSQPQPVSSVNLFPDTAPYIPTTGEHNIFYGRPYRRPTTGPHVMTDLTPAHFEYAATVTDV
jgi:hypothetical protein